MRLITQELIKELHDKYSKAGTDEAGTVGETVVSAAIINELVTRENFPTDSDYFYNIHAVYGAIDEYIESTYPPGYTELALKGVFFDTRTAEDIANTHREYYNHYRLQQFINETIKQGKVNESI